jgi:hypothetical protein
VAGSSGGGVRRRGRGCRGHWPVPGERGLEGGRRRCGGEVDGGC